MRRMMRRPTLTHPIGLLRQESWMKILSVLIQNIQSSTVAFLLIVGLLDCLPLVAPMWMQYRQRELPAVQYELNEAVQNTAVPP